MRHVPSTDPQRHRLHPLRLRALLSPGRAIAGAVVLGVAIAGACSVSSRMAVIAPQRIVADCRRSVGSDGSQAAAVARWTWSETDSSKLNLWCAAVGPAVVREVAATPADAMDSLVVVSWNVHVGGGDVSRFVDSLRAGRLTGGVPVRHFVLLLQEALRVDSVSLHPSASPVTGMARRIVEALPGGDRVEIVRLADSLGLALAYAPSMRNGWDAPEDRGNAILSTLPLADVQAVELPFEAQRRVAVTARVLGRSAGGCPWSLRVTDVHLDNVSAGWSITRTLGTGRLRQGRGLLAALAPDTSTVSLLAGDMNTVRGTSEEVVQLFRSQLPQSPTPVWTRTHATGLHLDHVFVRSPYGTPRVSRRVDDRFGSDHYPLLTRLRVAPANTCSP
ncbi:MAG TPA: endonuclease/exonuclease/phosphatase family protein [Longimicrobiaceae bacterium]|nr:endonuclease/exonuclease/phosphatase family protein [Longimicrobiaceae bacterium]